VAITASWQVFHVHPCAAPTAFTERSSSRTANAISRLARTVTRARGGTDGVDSVNDFRLQEVLVHNHFRFRHTIRGMSGSILMSRGQDVDGAGSVDIDVHGLDDDTVESEQQ
jgi:hypothetical protein